MVTQDGKRDFESFFSIAQSAQLFLRSILFMKQRKQFEKLKESINIFLKNTTENPIIKNPDVFIEIWAKNKPIKFTKWFFWSHILSIVMWAGLADYNILFNDKYLEKSPYPIYSPHFREFKLGYVVLDTVLSSLLVWEVVQPDIAVNAILGFLSCQLEYLKLVLDNIYEDGRRQNDDDNVKWWIKNHVQV